MNSQDEDFIFACLLGAYLKSLRQNEENQQQLQRGKAGVQQLGMRRIRRMKLLCSARLLYASSQTACAVSDRSRTQRTGTINRNMPGRTAIEREETATIHPSLP